MRNKVLYFPHIEVPQSEWLTRMLLYWDTVGVIMPYQFVEEPESLDENTRSLLQANLVTQVIPSEYIGDIPNFTTDFLSYLNSLGEEIQRRRKRFKKSRSLRFGRRLRSRVIHIEKMDAVEIHLDKTNSLSEVLIDLGLAQRSEYPWLSVEPRTAEEFMYYLATVLGKHPELEFAPVTDELDKLKRLTTFVAPENEVDESLDSLRLHILEDVLPAPSQPLPASEIANFKSKHGDQLGRFRRHIELELTHLADINNPELQRRRLDLFKEGINEEIDDIQSKMTASKWPSIVFGKLCAFLAAMPLINTVPSLFNATHNAIGSNNSVNDREPLAYAAYARHKLLHH